MKLRPGPEVAASPPLNLPARFQQKVPARLTHTPLLKVHGSHSSLRVSLNQQEPPDLQQLREQQLDQLDLRIYLHPRK